VVAGEPSNQQIDPVIEVNESKQTEKKLEASQGTVFLINEEKKDPTFGDVLIAHEHAHELYKSLSPEQQA